MAFVAGLLGLYKTLFPRLKERMRTRARGAARLREETEGKLLAGQFRVVREVGRGGMGVIYEAWDTRLERAAEKWSRLVSRNPPHIGICFGLESHTSRR